MNGIHFVSNLSLCSSAAGLLPTRNLVSYSSTKHAVHGLYDALRDELRMRNDNKVKITSVYPFYCSTGKLFEIMKTCLFESKRLAKALLTWVQIQVVIL